MLYSFDLCIQDYRNKLLSVDLWVDTKQVQYHSVEVQEQATYHRSVWSWVQNLHNK